MAGFQGNALTEMTAPAVGAAPAATAAPATMSTAQSIVNGLGSLMDTAARALPIMEKKATDAAVKDFVNRRQALDVMISQNPTERAAYSTRLNSWEVSLEQASPAINASVKQQLGIKDLNVAEARAAQEQDSLAFMQAGKAVYEQSNIPMPNESILIETGRDLVMTQRRTATELAILKTKTDLKTARDEDIVSSYTTAMTKDINDKHGSLLRAYSSLGSQVQPDNPKNMEAVDTMVRDLTSFKNSEIAQWTAYLQANGVMDNAVISKILKNSLTLVDNQVDLLKSGNKQAQDFVSASLTAGRDSVMLNLLRSGNDLAQLIALGGPQGLNTLVAAEQNKNTLDSFSKVLKNAVNGVQSFTSTGNAPREIMKSVFESGKEGTVAPVFKDKESRLAYVQGVNTHMSSFHKFDGITTQDAAVSYGNTTSKLLDTVTGLDKFENMSFFLKSLQGDKHQAAMAKMPPTVQKALNAKIGGTALDVARKTIQTVGTAEGAIIYNHQTGRYSVDTTKAGGSIVGRNAGATGPTLLGLLGSTPFTGQEETTKAEEWARLPAAVKTLNEMTEILKSSMKDDPRVQNLSDVEKSYLLASSLKGVNSAIAMTGEINLDGKLTNVSSKGENTSLDGALSQLSLETAQAIQSNINPKAPAPVNTQVGDVITPAPNPPAVETVPLIEDIPIEVKDGRPQGMTDAEVTQIVADTRLENLVKNTKEALGKNEQVFIKDVKKNLSNSSDDWATQLFDYISNKVQGTKEKIKEGSKPVLPESKIFVDAAASRGISIEPDKLKLLSMVIEKAESGGESDARTVKNPTTSATGYFQIVNNQRTTSAQSIINRYKKSGEAAPQWVLDAAKPMSKEEHTKFIGNLDRPQQEALFMARLFETNGSDKLIKDWINSGYNAEKAAEIYMRIHHTKPSTTLKTHFKIAERQVGKAMNSSTPDSSTTR